MDEEEEEVVVVREWIPGAAAVWLLGDFNEWRRGEYALSRKEGEEGEEGVWECRVRGGVIRHGMAIKLGILTPDHRYLERIPSHCRATTLRPPNAHLDALFWHPPSPHLWLHSPPPLPPSSSLRIYEAHVGMSGEEPRVHSYREFAALVLPHVLASGFNAVQLMAVMEHSYYASFGYQVTNFFAPSCRFGTPEDLKFLIDQAHGMGILVLLDLVHSHASSNTLDGLNQYDGTGDCFFHSEDGPRGRHPQWDSRLFDYGRPQVLRFLLSNVHYWLTEFRFDGFRMDGVTSMIYQHHGIGKSFSAGYSEYFGPHAGVDEDALCYLALACRLAHSLGAVMLAEEVSGYPGLARPPEEGGVGFDYRLHMGPADEWIRLLEDGIPDEQWSVGHLVALLMDRRKGEKHVCYSESHDQALVGDKTLMMRLAGPLIYTHMSVLSPPSLEIDRAVALHKIMSCMTWLLGGDALLVFMGNEWGHPEWIDFPRPGNNESYHWARRQWSLTKDTLLRYPLLLRWNQDVLRLDVARNWLGHPPHIVSVDEGRQTVAVERPMGQLMFYINLSVNSWPDQPVPGPEANSWRVLFSSDDQVYGGHSRVELGRVYQGGGKLYLPSRTLMVLERINMMPS